MLLYTWIILLSEWNKRGWKYEVTSNEYCLVLEAEVVTDFIIPSMYLNHGLFK